MNRLTWLLLIIVTATSLTQVNAQDVYQSDRTRWAQNAEQFKPQLTETIKRPLHSVVIKKDDASFQGWKAVQTASLDSLYTSSFNKRKEITLDFGQHLTGYFSFKVDTLFRTPDAPLKFRLTFGEVPSEVATPFDPYKGDLSRAWLQDEVITVMDVPSEINITRRLAFRYVKIELIGSSQYYDFKLSDVYFKAVTSVTKFPDALSFGASSIIKEIDQVGLNTLKECMQTVYEDGPKRDRRLWIGDLYLESLANSYSFKNHDLTRRCLYLLASLSDKNGYLIGTVFEQPKPHPQDAQFLMDYAFLYNVALKEFVAATGDSNTGNDLWPVAKWQLNIVKTYLKPDGMMDYDSANKEWWLFFDWKDGLHKEAALHGLTIYTMQNTYALAKTLHRENEVKELPQLIEKMKKAAKKNLFNKKLNLFESGNQKQISYASQIWMVLSGVLSKDESRKTLNALSAANQAVSPGGPYLYHYYIEALIAAGLQKEAKSALVNYWGGMVKKGADTFWEVYDPKDEYLSPYHFFPINSYCHAWSCTPVYFIRKYPEIFQN
ncbi:MAG: glycoside hydrolase [Sphingobacteriaceae bacterium]|nr:MAG: glycoside hydrolase [Sphingobacteriaceae bacterium]